jgi:hypothetical protein
MRVTWRWSLFSPCCLLLSMPRCQFLVFNHSSSSGGGTV